MRLDSALTATFALLASTAMALPNPGTEIQPGPSPLAATGTGLASPGSGTEQQAVRPSGEGEGRQVLGSFKRLKPKAQAVKPPMNAAEAAAVGLPPIYDKYWGRVNLGADRYLHPPPAVWEASLAAKTAARRAAAAAAQAAQVHEIESPTAATSRISYAAKGKMPMHPVRI